MVNPIPRRPPNPNLPNPFAPNPYGVTPNTQFPVPYQDAPLHVDYRSQGASSGARPPTNPPSVVGNEMQYYSHLAQSDPDLTDYAKRQAIQSHELGLSMGKKMFQENLQARKDKAMRDRMIQNGFMYPQGVEDQLLLSGTEFPKSLQYELQRRAFK